MKGAQPAFLVQVRCTTLPSCFGPGDKSEDSGESTGNAGRVLRPDGFAERLSSVSLDDLAADGIFGIIVDLDNTLVGYGLAELEAQDAALETQIGKARAKDVPALEQQKEAVEGQLELAKAMSEALARSL